MSEVPLYGAEASAFTRSCAFATRVGNSSTGAPRRSVSSPSMPQKTGADSGCMPCSDILFLEISQVRDYFL